MPYQQKLINTIKEDNIEEFITIIEHNNVDANKDILYEGNPTKMIIVAIIYHSMKILTSLINRGANVNIKTQIDSTILHTAATVGNTESLNIIMGNFKLKTHKDIYGNHPIHLATKNGHIDFVKYIVHCLDIDINTKKQGSNKTAFHIAIESGNTGMVLAIIELGCNLNLKDSESCTGFMSLIQIHGIYSLSFEYLMLDITNSILLKDKDNKNIIHMLICNNKLDLIRLIILSCKYSIYKHLINCQDNKGYTPLHYACELNMLNAVDLLILAHCDINKKNKDNMTPYDICMKKFPDDTAYQICKLLKYKSGN